MEKSIEDISVPVRKYLILFAAIFIACIIVGLIQIFIFHKNVSTIYTILSMIGASAATSFKFIKDNKRTPNKYEKRRLVWGCLLIVPTINIIESMIFSIFDNIALLELWQSVQVPPASTAVYIFRLIVISIAGIVVPGIVFYIFLHFNFGWFSRILLEYKTKVAERIDQ